MSNIISKSEFIESLTEEQFNAGLIKFNIPDEDDIYSTNGEGVWGWATQDDITKYNNDRYHGEITAILLNVPFNDFRRLKWGDEVKLKCHGCRRPTLDPDWVNENLL